MSSRALKGFVCGALAMCLGMVLVSCGSKVSQENFDRIKAGMSLEEVKGILGDPTESSGVGLGPLSGTSATWKDKDRKISIQFVNGKVTVKNFSKGG